MLKSNASGRQARAFRKSPNTSICNLELRCPSVAWQKAWKVGTTGSLSHRHLHLQHQPPPLQHLPQPLSTKAQHAATEWSFRAGAPEEPLDERRVNRQYCTVISIDDFLQKKRDERKSGKLAGLTDTILELRKRSATFAEIAEYLRLAHGISVTPRGIALHVQHRAARQLAPPPPAPQPTAPGAASEPRARASISETAPQPENVSNRSEASEVRGEGTTTEASRLDIVRTRYDRNSPEHLAMVAAHRLRNTESKT